MTLQEWFEKRKEAQIQRREAEHKIEDDGQPSLWIKCVHCENQILKTDLEQNMMVCPACEYHYRINATKRIKMLFDDGSFVERFKNVKPTDPLEFVDTEPYKDRLEKAYAKTKLDEAVWDAVTKLKRNNSLTVIKI